MSSLLLGVVLSTGLLLYALTAGADFGAGVWSLWSRTEADRNLVDRVIAPVWEANHVWMIFVVVTAFVFQAYGMKPKMDGYRYAFEGASLFTPVVLGMVAAGLLQLDTPDAWLTPFALAVGVFVMLLFSLLAATYFTLECEGELQTKNRRRAIKTEVLAGGAAYVCVLLAPESVEVIAKPLDFAPYLHGATALAAATGVAMLALRRFRLARLAVGLQVALVVIGYAYALEFAAQQRGFLLEVAPQLASALMPVLVVAALTIGPSLAFLYWVFRARPEEADEN